uniref:(northern house mosquito) hypothetical protein n=1 Tax=Culex pipiens TaxID=7175 RepID=A0A8D8AVF6_CULPI
MRKITIFHCFCCFRWSGTSKSGIGSLVWRSCSVHIKSSGDLLTSPTRPGSFSLITSSTVGCSGSTELSSEFSRYLECGDRSPSLVHPVTFRAFYVKRRSEGTCRVSCLFRVASFWDFPGPCPFSIVPRALEDWRPPGKPHPCCLFPREPRSRLPFRVTIPD